MGKKSRLRAAERRGRRKERRQLEHEQREAHLAFVYQMQAIEEQEKADSEWEATVNAVFYLLFGIGIIIGGVYGVMHVLETARKNQSVPSN